MTIDEMVNMLRVRMHAMHITHEQMAEKLDVSTTAISKWVNHRSQIPMVLVDKTSGTQIEKKSQEVC